MVLKDIKSRGDEFLCSCHWEAVGNPSAGTGAVVCPAADTDPRDPRLSSCSPAAGDGAAAAQWGSSGSTCRRGTREPSGTSIFASL